MAVPIKAERVRDWAAEVFVAGVSPITVAARFAWVFLKKFDEFVRTLDGQGAEHDGVHQTEDGGVGSRAESERENGDGSEDGAAAHAAEPVTNILPEIKERAVTPHPTGGFLDESPIAEFAAGGEFGGFRIFAAIYAITGGHA